MKGKEKVRLLMSYKEMKIKNKKLLIPTITYYLVV